MRTNARSNASAAKVSVGLTQRGIRPDESERLLEAAFVLAPPKGAVKMRIPAHLWAS
jgi:hypothetical protein